MDRVRFLTARAVLAFFFFAAGAASANDSNLNYDLMIDQKAAIAEIESMGVPDMPREVADGLRGEAGWFTIFKKVVDDIGRVLTVKEVVEWFWFDPNYSTCVYSSTAKSTPMYCY